MSNSSEDLLQPTLAHEVPAAAPYSVQTAFVTSFFGGPFAALAILATNSKRLRRLSQDSVVWGLILLALVAGGWLLFHSAAGADLRDWYAGQFGERAGRWVHRLLGIGIFAIGYVMHGREQRNADLAGLDRPNGWIGGIACVIFGFALSVLYFAILVA